MRLLAIPCLLVVSAQFPRTPLPVASSLAILTPRPRVDTPTSFKLASAPAGNVIWDFGDGTPPQSAPSAVSHTYRSPGNFTVKATAGRSVTQQSLTVIEPRKVVVSLGAGKSATLKLEEAIGSTLLWNFGDGGRPVEGSASLTHTFAREGDFTVKVQDTPPGLPPREFTAKVSIGKGSAVTFGVSRLTLRWEDGSVERNVPLGEAGLVAYADLGFEGSGTFQAEWLVDGKSQRSLSTTLGAPQPSNLRPLSAPAVSLGATTTAGNRQTLSTAANGQTPVPLPTNLPGEHRVTLKVIQPKLDFPVPVLRYTVQATSETSGLTIQSIMPSHGKPGEEVELTLTGTGFSADMALNLGKDVAVLGKPVLISPDKAVVRVFVAPTAQAGPRSFQIRRGGRSFGATASFEVVTAGQVPSGKEPGKLQTPSLGSVGKLPTTGTSVSPVQTGKEAGKGQVLPLGPAAKLTATSASANPALRQPPIDLARVGRSSAGASRMVPLQGAKGTIAILDVNAGSRFEKFLQCNEGQRLDLTKITLSSPSFSMIGYNSGGEFPRDIIPVLRDDTRFSWQEQKPGTSEYFELQFFAAKDGTLLKTQRVPGNRSTFDVTPAFVQELTRLIGQHIPKTMIATPSNASRPGLVTGSSPSSKERITTPHTPQRPLAMGQGKPVVSSTPAPAAVQSSQTSSGMSKAVIQAIAPKPDLEIPAVMQQKASVVWRVIGYRSYPCLSTPAIPEGIAKPATPTVALPPPRPVRGKTPSLPAPAVMTAGGKQTSPVITRTAGATPPAHGPSAASGPERSTPPVFQNVIAEVSRSAVWPFRVPAQPQGVNRNGCIVAQADPKIVLEANKKGNSGGSGHFRMVSTSHPKGASSSGNPPKNSLDESIYTFDEIWLHGEFDLSAARVPYRLIPASVLPKSGSGGGGQGGFPISTVGQVVFKNVFVDWGDGTLEAFRGQPVDQLFASSNGNYSGTDFYSRYKVDAGAMKHVYARAAIAPPYRVKVFVLSEEDMGRSNIVGEVSQALTPIQTNKGLFSGLSRLSAVTKTLPMTASPGAKTSSTGNPILSQTASKTQPSALSAAVLLDAPSSASQALGRAYEVFCRELPIVEREDPCANGPLNLVAVDLEFPANDKAPVPVAATSRTKASSPAANPPPLHTPKVQVPGSANRTSQTQLNASSMTAGAALSNTSGGEVNHGPTTTPCNLFYSVQTRVKYYGVGTLRVVWKVGGKQVGSREQPVKSPKRTGLKADECLSCKNPLYGELTLNSPALPVNVLGRQIVTAEVDVLPDKSGDVDLSPAMMGILSGAKASLAPRVAHTLTATLSTGKTAKLPLRLGILNPSPAPGQPAFVSLNKVAVAEGVQAALSAMTQPPFHVETSGVYEVKASDPAKLCNIFFPSKGGLFPITNLQGMKLTPEGSLSKATGKGLLVLGVKAGTAPDAIAPCPLPISFGDWSLDGVTVVQGKFDLKPDGQTGEYNGPGVKGAVKEVLGAIADKNAPQDMRLRMELSPIDTSMVTGDGTEAPKWLAEAPVTIQGDWYATKDLGGNPLKLGRTKLGPTPWFFQSDAITIDLSATEGSDPHGGGVDWVGVKLGTVTVEPSTLGVVGGQWANLPKPTNWTIEGLGVRGEMDTGSWQSDYRSGHLAIENIHFKGTKEGHYSASYKNVEIRSPWFKEPVRGNATWFKAEGGNYKLNLDGIHADKRPSLAGGALTLEPLDLQFVKIENGGLLLQGRAHLTLQAEGKHFATFDAERVGYGLDGLLYFGDDGKSSMTVPLHGNATLGSTPAELQKALLTAGPKENLLKVDVDTRLRLSANPVLPSAPTSLHYAMKSGGSPGIFSAPEVQVDPFSMDVAFPMGSPSMTAKINTNYTGKQSGQAESAMSADGISGGAPSISSNRFAGEVDLAMFGGSPLKAKFVLGYDQGKDYFATRVDVPMGRAGVVIIPEILTLYRLSGGFAYNFGDDVFKDGGSVLKAKPDFKGVTQLMAGARLGSADQFIYTLDGQLVIGSSGTARMDFGAWVCSMNPSGNPPLRGQLSYTNGTFDGALWGGFHYLGDMVAIDLGSSKETAACSLHFGGGEWHIYAGNRDGTRISGRIFGNTTESYLMLGSDVGLAVGGRQNWYFGAGVGVKAYAKAWLDMGLQITPQPKVIGDFRAGMEAGICVKHVGCISASVNAHVHAEALPLSVSASCCIDLPWPFDEACFTVKM